MKIQFIGLGYIGLPTAAVVSRENIIVHGVDRDPKIVKTIRKGKVHFKENGLNELVNEKIKCGYLNVSTNLQTADIHIIVVPTPLKKNRIPDISFVENATNEVIPYLEEGNTYILESTSPVGTTEKIASLIFSQRPELKNKIYIAYCPERVLPGNAIYELINNDRVIGGINDISTKKAMKFYKLFVKGKLYGTNSRIAELCKLTENSFRDIQVSFANEISIICDKARINVWELISLANRHPRVNILQPGTGVGGHCIAVDPWFIISDYPNEARLIKKAREINNFKTEWCIEKIKNSILEFKLNNERNPLVALMGLSFKPNVDDLRESPAKKIVNEIIKMFDDNCIIVEPNIESHDYFELTDYNYAYKNADIVAFLVAHNEFKQLSDRNNLTILDFCGISNN